jgi:glucose/mannose-6-phosphate isomerase
VAAFDGPYAPPPEPAFPAAEDFGRRGGLSEDPFDDGEFDSFADAGDDELGLDGPPMDEAQLRLVLLADQAGEHPMVERTRIAAASLAQARGIDVSEIAMEGGGPLRRLAGMVQLIDYASVYLGIASGIDPLAIAAIKDLRDLTGRE